MNTQYERPNIIPEIDCNKFMIIKKIDEKLLKVIHDTRALLSFRKEKFKNIRKNNIRNL